MFSQASVRSHLPWEGGGGRGVSGQRKYPLPRSRWGAGVTPSQVRMGGTPSQVRMGRGYPFLGQDRGGTQSKVRAGRGGGVSPNWNSIVCTCYAAGGMPLAFTQEDFLIEVEFFCLVLMGASPWVFSMRV